MEVPLRKYKSNAKKLNCNQNVIFYYNTDIQARKPLISALFYLCDLGIHFYSISVSFNLH